MSAFINKMPNTSKKQIKIEANVPLETCFICSWAEHKNTLGVREKNHFQTESQSMSSFSARPHQRYLLANIQSGVQDGVLAAHDWNILEKKNKFIF